MDLLALTLRQGSVFYMQDRRLTLPEPCTRLSAESWRVRSWYRRTRRCSDREACAADKACPPAPYEDCAP